MRPDQHTNDDFFFDKKEHDISHVSITVKHTNTVLLIQKFFHALKCELKLDLLRNFIKTFSKYLTEGRQ